MNDDNDLDVNGLPDFDLEFNPSSVWYVPCWDDEEDE